MLTDALLHKLTDHRNHFSTLKIKELSDHLNQKKIILKKLNKSDYFIINAYQMIILLSCTDKIIKKLTADAITTYCKINDILHVSQMKVRKHQSMINTMICLIQNV